MNLAWNWVFPDSHYGNNIGNTMNKHRVFWRPVFLSDYFDMAIANLRLGGSYGNKGTLFNAVFSGNPNMMFMFCTA